MNAFIQYDWKQYQMRYYYVLVVKLDTRLYRGAVVLNIGVIVIISMVDIAHYALWWI